MGGTSRSSDTGLPDGPTIRWDVLRHIDPARRSAHTMSAHRTPAHDDYDSGLLVGPADDIVERALLMDVHDDEVGDLLIALLGWDEAVQSLSSSSSDRAGLILPSVLSWLLVG